MMSRFTTADVVVVGMIGERGREVGEFAKTVLDQDSKSRTTIIAVPADRSPLLQIRGAERATAIAEYYRDQGKDVLLIMDSLTRVAHARREIGLALGEQPTARLSAVGGIDDPAPDRTHRKRRCGQGDHHLDLYGACRWRRSERSGR